MSAESSSVTAAAAADAVEATTTTTAKMITKKSPLSTSQINCSLLTDCSVAVAVTKVNK